MENIIYETFKFTSAGLMGIAILCVAQGAKQLQMGEYNQIKLASIYTITRKNPVEEIMEEFGEGKKPEKHNPKTHNYNHRDYSETPIHHKKAPNPINCTKSLLNRFKY